MKNIIPLKKLPELRITESNYRIPRKQNPAIIIGRMPRKGNMVHGNAYGERVTTYNNK